MARTSPVPSKAGATTASKSTAPQPDALDSYRRRRDPSITPEPVPATTPAPERSRGRGTATPRRFVVQEHHARALHWDFRLERDGVLVSWAIPKGLPLDKKSNHLAVHTEDHPLEYATFEGTIPHGEYGGGNVILWDVGTYDEIKWSDREVMVVLHGKKVTGQYVLFATAGGGTKSADHDDGRQWMVHRMDESPAGYEPPPHDVRPMLAAAGGLPKDDKAWAYEFKWDGIRAVGYVDGGRIRLTSRSAKDLSRSFPELRALGEHFGSHQVVVDGEITAFDDKGRPRFQLLQPRIHASDDAKSTRLAAAQPIVYMIFDLLYLDGTSLMALPYAERRRRLESLGLEKPVSGTWTVSPRFEGPGADIVQASKDQGLEGIVAKRLDAPYLPGKRSPTWTKVKNIVTQEVVIGGWTPGQGHRQGRLGSLLLGLPVGAGLQYVGQVGTGFTDTTLDELGSTLDARRSKTNPFVTDVPSRYRNVATWVEPTLVGEVSFTEWTAEGRMRHPAWRGLRPDKEPTEVRRES